MMENEPMSLNTICIYSYVKFGKFSILLCHHSFQVWDDLKGLYEKRSLSELCSDLKFFQTKQYSEKQLLLYHFKFSMLKM